MKGNGKEGVGTGLDVFGSSQKKYLYSESEIGCSFPFNSGTAKKLPILPYHSFLNFLLFFTITMITCTSDPACLKMHYQSPEVLGHFCNMHI